MESKSITDRTITSPTTTKITPTNHSTAAAGVGIGGRVSHDGALGGWEEGEGEGKGEGGGGDIRAVTSGMISSNNGMLVESPEIGREAGKCCFFVRGIINIYIHTSVYFYACQKNIYQRVRRRQQMN